MTRFALHRVALITGLGGLLIVGSIRLDAQNNGQNSAQQPTFRAGANFVRVDVYPTIKGAAVRDLTQPDFDILEDGVPQKIESFEYVNVRGAGPEVEQHEPNSVAEARQIAETTKGRLFVISSTRTSSTSAARIGCSGRWSTSSIASSVQTTCTPS